MMYEKPISRRRALGAIGTTGLLATGLAGCSTGSNQGGSSSVAAKQLTLPKETPVDSVKIPASYVGPKPFSGKPFATSGSPKLKVVVPLDSAVVGDWNKNKFSAWLQQRTGLDIEYQAVSVDNGDMTKVNAMIASSDLPDVFLTIPFTLNQVALYGSQGVFIPLEGYISQTRAIKQMFADYPDAARLTKAPDGHTYVIPQINDCRQCKVSPGRAWVNKQFLEKVGLDVPNTTDEFRAVLRAFKTKNPNGHGDVVPFAAGVGNDLDRFFMNAFLYNPGEPWLRLTDGKVTFVADKPEWRDALSYMSSLHSDGTLSPQAFTLTAEGLLDLGNTPGHQRIGVARDYFWGSFMTIVTKPDAPWHDYVPIPALQGPSGVRYAAWDYYQPYALGNFVITSKCSRPDLAIMWAEYQTELEATLRSCWGMPGRDWSYTGGKTPAIDGKPSIWEQNVGGSEASVPPGTGWNQQGVLYRSNDFRLEEQYVASNPAFAAVLDQATVTPYQPYKQPQDWELPPLVMDTTTAARVADIQTTLTELVSQGVADFATGKRNPDDAGAWASYLKSLTTAGTSEYLELYQKAYEGRSK